jgi:thioredoxin 1
MRTGILGAASSMIVVAVGLAVQLSGPSADPDPTTPATPRSGRSRPSGSVSGQVASSTAVPQSTADATQAVADAVAAAKTSRKHVLLNFGADWCLECRLLTETFAEPSVAEFLEANFIVVSVHIGRVVLRNYAELNTDLVRKYGLFTTEENTGIPYVVILNSEGRVLARTNNGEWRHADAVLPENVIKDLKRWAPKPLL